MGRVALILLLLFAATKSDAAGPVQGVALTADGVVLAPGREGAGVHALVEVDGREYPARVLATDDELGLVLLGSEAKLKPVMLADEKTISESRNFCALIFPTAEARCDKLTLSGRITTDRLTLGDADGDAVAGTLVFSRRAKLVGVLVSVSGAEAVAVHARAIRRMLAAVPGLTEKLVPMRSAEVNDFRRLPEQLTPHLVSVRYDGQVNAIPNREMPLQAEAGKAAVTAAGAASVKGGQGRTPAKSKQPRQKPSDEKEQQSTAAEVEMLHAGGARHFHAGRYTEAYRAYRQAAEKGYAKSQVSLGALYEEGLGVPRDYEAAAAWYRKAAEAGELLGYMNLGRMFELGRGVAEDPFHAAVLYSKAAERGHKPAHQALDRLFHKER